MPTFSIIIISFNEGDWPKKTLDGILADQSYSDYEVILVDDGSADGSFEFLKKEPYLSLQKEQKLILLSCQNLGASRGRHLGATHATGQTLIFLDAHMEINFGWLEKINQTLITSPEVHLLTGTVYDLENPRAKRYSTSVYSNTDYKFSTGSWVITNQKINEGIFQVPFVNGAFFIIRKSVYQHIGGFPDYLEGWGISDRALSMIAYYYGYDAWKDPLLSIGHYYKSKPTATHKNPEKKAKMTYNRLATQYLLINRKYFQMTLYEESKKSNFYSMYELFVQKLPALKKFKRELKKNQKRTFTQFKKQFQDFLPFYNLADYWEAIKIRRQKPQTALKLLKNAAKIKYCFSNHKKNELTMMAYFKSAQIFFENEAPRASARGASCEPACPVGRRKARARSEVKNLAPPVLNRARLSNKQFQKAIKYALKAFHINPSYLPLLELISLIYIDLHQPVSAIPYLEFAIKQINCNSLELSRYEDDVYDEIEQNIIDKLNYCYQAAQ